MRVIRVAAAQMGAIQKAEGRQQVVARMIALMNQVDGMVMLAVCQIIAFM